MGGVPKGPFPQGAGKNAGSAPIRQGEGGQKNVVDQGQDLTGFAKLRGGAALKKKHGE